jgi:predicted HTH transcriptional regulator
MYTLGADDIRALAEAGESQTVEFKLENETQPDISELLSAFANADGGVVLFGVTDEGSIVGLARPNVVQSRLIAAAQCLPPAADTIPGYLSGHGRLSSGACRPGVACR